MVNNQTFLFIIFTLIGILIGVIFDFFRILRKSFTTKDFVTYIEDVCFWIITEIIVLYSIYIFCNGELRFFIILGIFMGLAIYMFTISKYIIKFSVIFLKILKSFFAIFKPHL